LVFDSSAPIDLHIHSTASDGSLSAVEILRTARQIGLAAISITDHDTLEGARDALKIGVAGDLKFLPGVEISAGPPDNLPISGSMHLLGYNISLNNQALNHELAKLQAARANRNPEIVRLLNEIGLPMSYESLLASWDGQLSRPHIASHMLEKGYVTSIDEAFDNYLSRGKPAYVDKYRVDWRRAIEVVRSAGGVCVLAHPSLLELSDVDTLEGLIVTLKTAGLGGIEVFYPEHTPEQTEFYKTLALRYDLLMTGGSDFHGAINPHIRMGVGSGDLSVPYSLYEKLIYASSCNKI
jgi:predicted metal-dependent phosphoesterase TrpH